MEMKLQTVSKTITIDNLGAIWSDFLYFGVFLAFDEFWNQQQSINTFEAFGKLRGGRRTGVAARD